MPAYNRDMSCENPEEEKAMLATETIDSRQSHRLKPAASCHVIDALSASLLGEVLNISSDGLMLASPLSIGEGSIFQVDIHCDLSDVGRISAGIECLWTEPYGNGGTLAGFHIIDISDQDQDVLHCLLAASS